GTQCRIPTRLQSLKVRRRRPMATRAGSDGNAFGSVLARRGSFITLALTSSRCARDLKRDPRKNDGLVRRGVDQTRERYLSCDVEVLADAFPICQGAMVSPDVAWLLCNLQCA